MIYAITEARKNKPFNNYIDIWAVQVMANLYNYYLQTEKRDPRFKEQNYKYCIKYYHTIYKEIEKRIPQDHQDAVISQVLSEQAPGMPDIVPSITIHDFIKQLASEDETLYGSS